MHQRRPHGIVVMGSCQLALEANSLELLMDWEIQLTTYTLMPPQM